MKRFFPVILVLALIALLGYALLTGGGDDSTSALEGSPAPTFAGTALEGQPLDLAKYKGKPLMINFWASWCDPCKTEAPLLSAFYQDHGSKVQMLGILIHDKLPDAMAFTRQFNIGFPSLPDPDFKVASDYGVTGQPETFFINAKGIIVKRYMGPMTAEILKSNLEKIGVVL